MIGRTAAAGSELDVMTRILSLTFQIAAVLLLFYLLSHRVSW